MKRKCEPKDLNLINFKVFTGYGEKYIWGEVKHSIFWIITTFLNVIKNFQGAILKHVMSFSGKALNLAIFRNPENLFSTFDNSYQTKTTSALPLTWNNLLLNQQSFKCTHMTFSKMKYIFSLNIKQKGCSPKNRNINVG